MNISSSYKGDKRPIFSAKTPQKLHVKSAHIKSKLPKSMIFEDLEVGEAP